jgi:polyphosphate kinase
VKLSYQYVSPETLIDRELSWLSFNTRVLELAEDSAIPLLERLRFLAIVSSNLDDFFMIRVASVKLKIESGIAGANSAGFSSHKQLELILEDSRVLIERQNRLFHDHLVPELAQQNIHFVHWKDLTEIERSYVSEIFAETVFPVLTPLAVDPTHPFPYISGLSISLAVLVKHPETKEEFFARVKIPNILPRFIPTHAQHKTRFIALEELIAAHLTELFPGMTIEDYYSFRLTRNEDLELDEDESDNLLETMVQELSKRRFGPPVRLEVESDIQPYLLERLMTELEISEREVMKYKGPLDLTGLNQIADLDLPELKFKPFKSQVPNPLIANGEFDVSSFFDLLRNHEILLHHPYHSFTSTVVQFLEAAATDPDVLAIKQTLYRTSGDSPIIEALIEAASAGKQVLAVIEIRARFDELANMRWAEKLEAAGVHVVYGLMGLKTHAKLSLVVRKEGEKVQRYCHVGTGNYNPRTARLYEDLGLLSSNEDLCDDLSRLFNQLSGFVKDEEFSRLIVAPYGMRTGLLAKISKEISAAKKGKPSGIRLKLNSLVDEEFIDRLYEASIAGVPVEIFVRGICSLVPGIPGKSDNIKVKSYLGRFLEHSRIYSFYNGGDLEYWIGSADLMQRNLDRRIETLIRIESASHKKYLNELLGIYGKGEMSHWQGLQGNVWRRVTQDENNVALHDLHNQLLERYANDG